MGGTDARSSHMKVAQAIRICTPAPLIALIMLVLLKLGSPDFFLNTAHFICAIICLCVLPLLAYPVSFVFHSDRERFRERQRKLAIVFALVGYIVLLVLAFANGYTHGELAVYLDYVISAVVIAATTPFPKVKASGHACGTAGPIAILVYFLSPWYLFGAIVLAAVFWSSVVLRRHTIPQLIIGSLTSILIVVVLAFIGFI